MKQYVTHVANLVKFHHKVTNCISRGTVTRYVEEHNAKHPHGERLTPNQIYKKLQEWKEKERKENENAAPKPILPPALVGPGQRGKPGCPKGTTKKQRDYESTMSSIFKDAVSILYDWFVATANLSLIHI